MRLIRFGFPILGVLASLAMGSVSVAAPPTLTALVPAGGQCGTTVEVTASGSFDTWPANIWASDSAVTVTAAKTKGTLTVNIGKNATPGICWLRVHDKAGASQLRPFFVGTVPEVREVEPNDTPIQPQVVTLPAVVNGKLAKSGDVDCFAVTLRKGATLVASLEANQTLRSPMDSILQITSVKGTVLEQNHDHHGLDPQAVLIAPQDGTYLVRIFAFPSQPDSSIRHFGSDACLYRLTLTSGGVIDYVTPLSVEVGREATLTAHGWNIPQKPLVLPAKETRITPDWSVTSGIVIRESHPCYDFTTTKPTDTLTPSFSLTGLLNSSTESKNSYRVTGKKGKPWAVRLNAASLGLPLTPVVRIVDTTQKQVARLEPSALNSDLEARFNPPTDGTYTVEVFDLYGYTGPRFVYRLRIAEATPTFEPTVTTDRFTATSGQTVDIPLTIGAKDGFKDELDWKIDGLPKDVTHRIVPPTGKGAPSTVTLKIEAPKTGFQGAIRIHAVAKTDPKTSRTVTTKLADFDTTTTDLWLTIPPAAAKP